MQTINRKLKQHKITCRICGKEYKHHQIHDTGYGTFIPDCDCEEKQRQIEEEKAEIRKKRKFLIDSGIPRRMLGYTFDSYPGEEGKVKKVKNYAESHNPGLLTMAGNTGTGKSGLAVACAKTMIAKGIEKIKYQYAYDLLVLGANFEKRIDTLNEALSWDLLIVDEIGIQLKSAPALEFLERLLIGRYEDLKATILITNLEPDDFWNLVGFRVKDRIKNCGQSLAFSERNLRNA